MKAVTKRDPGARQHGLGRLGRGPQALSNLDEQGRTSRRTVRPLAMVYYVYVTLIAAWCELRADYRHFRVDRVRACETLEEDFAADAARHRAEWLALRRED